MASKNKISAKQSLQTCASIAKKSQIVWAVPKHCEQTFYAVLQGFWQPLNKQPKMENKSKDDSTDSQYSILNLKMRCKFKTKESFVTMGVQLCISLIRTCFYHQSLVVVLHGKQIFGRAQASGGPQKLVDSPKCVFHVLSWLQSCWKHNSTGRFLKVPVPH